MHRPAALFAALLSVTELSAATAEAQEREDRSPRVAVNLALGFAGELDTQVGNSRADVDLDPTVGFDVRGELPVLDFLAVGVWFEMLGVLTDTNGAEREETVGFDAYVRARWVFEVIPSDLFIEPYLLLPLGFTAGILPDDDGSGDDVWAGWNTGVLAGAQVLHGSGFGGYLEFGWRHAEVYDHRSVTILGTTITTDLALTMNELALNFGAVYSF
jgi:hypothetical protein